MLGTPPDAEIARRLGRSESSVQSRRLKLGIPWINPARRAWTGEELQLLGTLPDAVLAERFGRTKKAILSKRLALKIPQPNKRDWLGHLGLRSGIVCVRGLLEAHSHHNAVLIGELGEPQSRKSVCEIPAGRLLTVVENARPANQTEGVEI